MPPYSAAGGSSLTFRIMPPRSEATSWSSCSALTEAMLLRLPRPLVACLAVNHASGRHIRADTNEQMGNKRCHRRPGGLNPDPPPPALTWRPDTCGHMRQSPPRSFRGRQLCVHRHACQHLSHIHVMFSRSEVQGAANWCIIGVRARRGAADDDATAGSGKSQRSAVV